jgi:hypothetical protein
MLPFSFSAFELIYLCLRRINRGNEMLIAFHSSPYSAPLQTGTPNRGFELNVDILYTDSDSYDFVQAPKCEFHINASSPGENHADVSFAFMSVELFPASSSSLFTFHTESFYFMVFRLLLLTSHIRALHS